MHSNQIMFTFFQCLGGILVLLFIAYSAGPIVYLFNCLGGILVLLSIAYFVDPVSLEYIYKTFTLLSCCLLFILLFVVFPPSILIPPTSQYCISPHHYLNFGAFNHTVSLHRPPLINHAF